MAIKWKANQFGNQRRILQEYINSSHNCAFTVIDEYIDDGYTGTNFSRPNFQRLLEDIEKGLINCVLSKDLSRLGRDHIMTGYYIEKFFKEKNIRYIAINDNMDTDNDDTLDMIAFKMSFNDYYPHDISKKIKKVKMMKMQKGEYQAGQPPFRL